MRNARGAGGLDETSHGRNDLLCARNGELPAGSDEVDLRVDVPEDDPVHRGYVTSCIRGFGRNRRPTLAEACPSVRTMSPVKSFEPRMSDEPTP